MCLPDNLTSSEGDWQVDSSSIYLSIKRCYLDLTARRGRTPPLLHFQVLREQSSDERTDHKHTTDRCHSNIITHKTYKATRTHARTHTNKHTQYLQLTALHQLDDVIKQHVSVPLTETADIIRHLDRQTGEHLSR